MARTFKIITLGCKVNQYESAYIKDELLEAGWVQAAPGQASDVAIINTCIVTGKASHQSRQAIRKAIKENPGCLVSATGCYAQLYPDELLKIDGAGLIVSNAEKSKLPELILEKSGNIRSLAVSDYRPDQGFDFLPIRNFPDKSRAYLKIQDGCQSFCSYCIVPYTRGHYRSLAPEKVIAMMESYAEKGFREIILTGIHLGKYGVDLSPAINLNGLLKLIGKKRLPVRVRLSSIEPNEIDMELIEMVAGENWLCRHFHIPLQSGDDNVLSRMKRTYSSKDFSALAGKIYDTVPLAAIGVDVMAGFPGENVNAHRNTYSLIENLPISYLHVFPFSARPGTPAASFEEQLEPGVIKKRAEDLRILGKIKKNTFYSSCLDRDFSVVVEGWQSIEKKKLKGLTDNYLTVNFESEQNMESQLVDVTIIKVEGETVTGRKKIRQH